VKLQVVIKRISDNKGKKLILPIFFYIPVVPGQLLYKIEVVLLWLSLHGMSLSPQFDDLVSSSDDPGYRNNFTEKFTLYSGQIQN